MGGLIEIRFYSDGTVEGSRVSNLFHDPWYEDVPDYEIGKVHFHSHSREDSCRQEEYWRAARILHTHPRTEFSYTYGLSLETET